MVKRLVVRVHEDMINNRDKIRINDSVLVEEIDGQMVLLNSDNERYFSLNEEGTLIWQLLKEQNSPEQIVDILKQQYEVEANILRADVEKLLMELKAAGLLSD